jgi:hypothetical protein
MGAVITQKTKGDIFTAVRNSNLWEVFMLFHEKE